MPAKIWKNEDMAKLCTYKGYEILVGDFGTLYPNTYLNDAIIDFYLYHLIENKCNDIVKQKVYIFSSLFYGKLKGMFRYIGVNQADNNCSNKQPETLYNNLKRWTQSFSIFDKDILIFPICEKEHWTTLIVVNPSKPRFIALDSLVHAKSQRYTNEHALKVVSYLEIIKQRKVQHHYQKVKSQQIR